MPPSNHPLDLTPLQNALASLRRGLARWQAAGEHDEELRDACICETPSHSTKLSLKLQKSIFRSI